MRPIWIATLLTATSLAAAPTDFAGTWKVNYDGPPMTGPKTIGSMILSFTVNGDRVTGIAHIGSWPGVAPIADGKIEGDQVSFTARGYLSSTTGIPTCQVKGTLSAGELVVQLSTVRNPGGPGSGAVWVYRGGKLDDAAAKTAKMEALTFLTRRRRPYPQYPDSNVAAPLTAEQVAASPQLDANSESHALNLSRMIKEWETSGMNPVPSVSADFSATDLDRLLAFYSSPIGQSLVATVPHGEREIQHTAVQFVAR